MIVLLIGLAGTVVALHHRSANPQFADGQENVSTVTSVQLENLMLSSRDTRPGHRGDRATSARCTARTTNRMVWSCRVRYPKGAVSFRLNVASSGAVTGYAHAAGLSFHGCCVSPPARTSEGKLSRRS